MKKLMMGVGIFVLLSFVGSQLCSAQLINYHRRHKTPVPAAPASQNNLQSNRPAAPAVGVPPPAQAVSEMKEDIIDPRFILQNVVATVDQKGSFIVNSDALKKYDKNSDGLIGKAEAKAIEADLR